MPELAGSYNSVKIVQPTVFEPPKTQPRPDNVPREWYPPSSSEKGWRAMVIHHSLTKRGNAAMFDDYHRNGHKWKGVGYNFVIGNGNGSRDGAVEVTFRWHQQIAGAHCGGTPGNWANKDAIGICLVGDFTYSRPTRRQMQSLLKLVRFLQKRLQHSQKQDLRSPRDAGLYRGDKVPG
ncbi:MAG: peptidoglycan recognition protein family protein [Planctomycetota bacterium]